MEKYLKGYVRVRLTGYGPERFLNLCQYHQIAIWGLAYVQGAYEFHMYRKDFIRCRSLTRKTKTRLHIVEKKGLPALLRRWRKRKALAVGLLLAAGLMYQLTGHIWDIQFSGNTACMDEMLAELLDAHDIVHGMKKSQVSCEEIDILVDLAWKVPGVLGSRITGGGFGGCIVALIPEELVPAVQQAVAEQYEAKTGIKETFYVCKPSQGAGQC